MILTFAENFVRNKHQNPIEKMKKTFLLIAAALMMGSSAFAGGGLDFAIGPKIGYQTAKLSYQKDDIKAGFANSFTIGVFGRVEIGNFYVQPEVLWFKSSNVFDMSIDSTNASFLGYSYPDGLQFTMTRNAMNIQVPVMIGYKLNLLNKLALRAQAGPTANFIIPSNTVVQSVSLSGQTELPEQLENADFDTKSIAWGVQMGVGIDFMKFTLDINYNLGISKVFGADVINNTTWGQYIDTGNIDNTKQNMFMVTLGYKFL